MTIYTKITELEERIEKLEKKLRPNADAPSREPRAKYGDYYCAEFKYRARNRKHNESLWRVIFKGDLPPGNSEIKRINAWKTKNGVPEYMTLSLYRDAEEGDDVELDETIRRANEQEDASSPEEVYGVCEALQLLTSDLFAGLAELVSFAEDRDAIPVFNPAGEVTGHKSTMHTLHITYREVTFR